MNSARLDAWLAGFWGWARGTRLVQWDSFEPALVLTAFTVFLLCWRAADLGALGRLGRRLGQYRLQPGGSPGGTHLEHSRRIWKVEGKGLQEFLLYLVPLLVLDSVFPRRVLPLQAPTAATLSAQVLAALLVYDALFAATHRLMHHVPFLFHRVHAKHHANAHSCAREIFRLSAAEEVVDTACR